VILIADSLVDVSSALDLLARHGVSCANISLLHEIAPSLGLTVLFTHGRARTIDVFGIGVTEHDLKRIVQASQQSRLDLCDTLAIAQRL